MSQDIRDLIFASHFVPFEINLKSGKLYLVPTREHAWVSPAGTIRVVLGPPENWHTVLINPAEIETVRHEGV